MKRLFFAIAFVLSGFVFTPTRSSCGAECDTASWEPCTSLVRARTVGDCSYLECTRLHTGYDANHVPTFGPLECPKIADAFPEIQEIKAGDVRVQVDGPGGLEGAFSQWTTGATVVCSTLETCGSCEEPVNMEFNAPCKSSSSQIEKQLTDRLGLAGSECDPYAGGGYYCH